MRARIHAVLALAAGTAAAAVLAGCSGGGGGAGAPVPSTSGSPAPATTGAAPTGFAVDTVVPTGGSPGATQLSPSFTCNVLSVEWNRLLTAYKQTGENNLQKAVAVDGVASFYADLAYDLSLSAQLSSTFEAAQDVQLEIMITAVSQDVEAVGKDFSADDAAAAGRAYAGRLQTDETTIATACSF